MIHTVHFVCGDLNTTNYDLYLRRKYGSDREFGVGDLAAGRITKLSFIRLASKDVALRL